jgi:hypothetical protein
LVSPNVAGVEETDEVEVKLDEEVVDVNDDEQPELIEQKKLNKFDEAFLACSTCRSFFLPFL